MSLTKGASRPWYLSAKGQWLWGGLSLLGLCLLWALSTSSPAGLQMEVPGFPSWSLLETKRAYLYLHIFTFLPVFLLSFDKKVHFYKKWKFLFPAIGMVGLFFILWDEYFTKVGVWGFNPDYLMGWYVLDLPVEEMLFFFTVPYACVFTYECLKVYLPKDPLVRWEQPISYGLLILFLVVGFFWIQHMYTATTFLLCASLQAFHMLYLPASWRSRFYLGYAITLIPFLLVNGVLTGGITEAPIVIYNPEEFFGLRILSIPVDDIFYGYLLIFSVATLFELFRAK